MRLRPPVPATISCARALFSTTTSSAHGRSNPKPPPPPPQFPFIPPRTLLFFATPIAVTFSLGVWQLHRLNRKLNLIKQREEALDAPTLTSSELLAAARSGSVGSYDHRRVQLIGRFWHDCEMLVGPRGGPKDLPMPVQQWAGTTGVQVLTPFELDSGEVVLVNRGWVPKRLKKRETRGKALVSPHPFMVSFSEETPVMEFEDEKDRSGRCVVEGVVRGSEEVNRFTPRNDGEKGEWYYVDIGEMMKSVGEGERGVMVEVVAPLAQGGWPVSRGLAELKQFRTSPETHVTYAATWFCLSAALGVITRWKFRR